MIYRLILWKYHICYSFDVTKIKQLGKNPCNPKCFFKNKNNIRILNQANRNNKTNYAWDLRLSNGKAQNNQPTSSNGS